MPLSSQKADILYLYILAWNYIIVLLCIILTLLNTMYLHLLLIYQ